jgi:hypothetical protein
MFKDRHGEPGSHRHGSRRVGTVDPRVGGDDRIGMLLPGRAEPRFVSGPYCRVGASRTLSFTRAWEPHRAGTREAQVTVEFHPRGTGTDPVLTHERSRDEADKDGHAQGRRGRVDRPCRKLEG